MGYMPGANNSAQSPVLASQVLTKAQAYWGCKMCRTVPPQNAARGKMAQLLEASE